MMQAALFISGWNWFWPAAILVCAALLLLFWSYSRIPTSRGVRTLCVLLKFLGLAALGFCLLEPLWSSERARSGANFFALVADNSQGMQIKDRGESRSRGEVLRDALIADKSGWQEQLEETFQARKFQFDSRLQSTRDFGELHFDGNASAIGASLRLLADRYQGQPLAGVLLFTDGNATDLADVSELPGLPPVYPVIMGRDDPIKDISVQKVGVTQTAFEDAPVTVEATVSASGYSGVPLRARLIEFTDLSRTNSTASKTKDTKTSVRATAAQSATNALHANVQSQLTPGFEKVVAEQTLDGPQEGEALTFRFQVKPTRHGISFYRLQVSARDEVDQFNEPAKSQEATLANNTRMVVVDRGRGPYRILYVAGRPNWEFKFLNRALAEDDQIQLTALIRVAKREAKFEFKGRAGESSNPLFRGFDKQGDDTERYDQPVFKILSWRDEPGLAGGFPKKPEDLYGFHAVIVDDLESEFFMHDQMVLVEKFVSERGGGFLMLGGMESFAQGKYARTPIGDLLPVYVDRASTGGKASEFKMDLKREGLLQPWARLRSTETDEKARLGSMPPFKVVNQVRELKPGASVLATVKDVDGKELPALIVQRFGRGRSAALTIGDMWRWGMKDEAMHRDMDKAWRQMVRWLVADVPERVQFAAETKSADQNQAVQLHVRVRDQKFKPLDNATVKVNVRYVGEETSTRSTNVVSRHPEGQGTGVLSVPLSVEPAASEAGLYQSVFVPRGTGAYLAESIVTDSEGVEVGHAEAGWTSDPAADEFRSLKPNRALMEAIAKKTGGEVISIDRLKEFVASLPSRKAPITEPISTPLWHTPIMFLIALGCFVGEWGVRRWKGLV